MFPELQNKLKLFKILNSGKTVGIGTIDINKVMNLYFNYSTYNASSIEIEIGLDTLTDVEINSIWSGTARNVIADNIEFENIEIGTTLTIANILPFLANIEKKVKFNVDTTIEAFEAIKLFINSGFKVEVFTQLKSTDTMTVDLYGTHSLEGLGTIVDITQSPIVYTDKSLDELD